VPPLATFGAAIAVLCAAVFRLAGAVAAIRLLRTPLPRLLPGPADLRLVRAWALPLEAGR
jgi:hypothetical protein